MKNISKKLKLGGYKAKSGPTKIRPYGTKPSGWYVEPVVKKSLERAKNKINLTNIDYDN